MCGIIGYVGFRPASPILLEGLQRLEYRGYDSSGMALVNERGAFVIRKAVGKLSNLRVAVEGEIPSGNLGIGHTRWATHGRPSLDNAHPHQDCSGDVVVIHNGIVENYLALKEELVAQGHTFVSQTDTEVLPHLIESFLAQGADLAEAVRKTMAVIQGAHAIVALRRQEPDRLVAVRLGNAGGLVVGYGEGEMFLASDPPALVPYTRNVVYLSHLEMAVITAHGATYYSEQGTPVTKTTESLPYDEVALAKGRYKHFMHKEMWEQPHAVMDTLRGRLNMEPPQVDLEELGLSPQELAAKKRVVLVACGTSYHAALVGKFVLEELTRLPVEADYASEFRYRDPILDPDTLLVAITQSGETVDTLAAMETGRAQNVKELAICNVAGSQATRLAHGVIHTRSGPEIGVASTKTFTCQLTALYLLAAYLGYLRGIVSGRELGDLLQEMVRIPHLLGELLAREAEYEPLARRYFRLSNFLYLGRGINYPVALEGALKLKEISYIHAEGYPAGEMKHGPIALIDENMPVVAIALKDRVYDKILNNIEEVKARDGTIIALATEGDKNLASRVDHVINIPPVSYLLSPLLTVLPLQLLAYHIAVRRGCDVDQPRNLAKSVTVE
ncbi:MAG: glutamine--fructose-6-phosphate transaminase (isomerizing) [Chloroflexi bacterium]|nr:glutamine--fructose-6-phosphate transaminase (isomerizing) [Chloroflexota bacterium]